MQINPKDIKRSVTRMGMLKYFPADAETRGEIGALLARMCPHLEALEWLTRQLIDGVGEWPGPAELRRILCSRWAPADRDPFTPAEPDDIDWSQFPSHADERALPPASTKMLTAAQSTDLATIPDRPAEVAEVIAHFSKPWPRGSTNSSGETRKLEEQLERDKAEATPLTEDQKRSRILELESALGVKL